MTTANPRGSHDSNAVSVTLTAEHAARAHTAARYLLIGPLDSYPEPWNRIAPFGTKQIDEWLDGLVALTIPSRALLEQFERAGVRDWALQMQLGLREKSDRTGDRLTDADPLPPATTGPVTITTNAALLEELARELLGFNEQDHDDYEVENQAGESIRDQLEAARS